MGKNKKTGRKSAGSKEGPPRLELELDELRAILERAKSAVLNTEDHSRLEAAVETLAYVTQELEAKGTSLARLRKLLFGSKSEKTKDVVDKAAPEGDAPFDAGGEPEAAGPPAGAGPDGAERSPDGSGATKDGKKPPRKGHGRNSASDYQGAERKPVPHDSVLHRDLCPCCKKGKVYRQLEPALLVRVRGVGPLDAAVYELERLRCNLCDEVFTAEPPPGVGHEKYDETATTMIALLKYGCGLPFHRIEKLGDNLGIPLPASTQWEVIEKAAGAVEPAWTELVHTAAQGELVHTDDTSARVLKLHSELQQALAEGKTDRTGIFTSGVVAKVKERQIALFFTGCKHAGENLAEVLAQRSADLKPPIQMGDASSRNTAGDFESLVACCLAHARRNFVDVVTSFPEEVRHVLEALREVYRNDGQAKDRGMSDDERLVFHKEHSGPVMEELQKWLQERFDARKVEPNSTLGQAIRYMQKHWEKLTLFLREPGSPLDNNICERALKRAILHRKNALFYKTINGAHVGDVFMSLIYTAELSRVNPFDYLVALQRHRKAVEESPAGWMPWNYHEALAQIATSANQPPPQAPPIE